jgi:hypothetical protein
VVQKDSKFGEGREEEYPSWNEKRLLILDNGIALYGFELNRIELPFIKIATTCTDLVMEQSAWRGLVASAWLS